MATFWAGFDLPALAADDLKGEVRREDSSLDIIVAAFGSVYETPDDGNKGY